MRVFRAVLLRDMRYMLQRFSDTLTMLGFFIITVVLFPLSLSPEAAQLRLFAPAIIWVVSLFAAVLSLPAVFAADESDGTLEALLIRPGLPQWLVLSKMLAHWLFSGLPLVLLSSVLGSMLGLEWGGCVRLMQALCLGSLTVSVIGVLGAAVVLGARGGSMLLMLLVFPLYVPVVVFGAAASVAAPLVSTQALWALIGILLFSLPIGLWLGALALKNAVK